MPVAVIDRLASTIDDVSSSSDLIHLLRASADLASRVETAEPTSELLAQLLGLVEVDLFAALAAIEALGRLDHPGADSALVELLNAEAPIVRRHASWRLRSKEPNPAAFVPVVHRVTLGGIDTLHAHRTLRHWSSLEPRLILTAIRETLPTVEHAAGRARLVDLIGVIDHPTAETDLLMLARDGSEAPAARAAAIGAIGHRAVSGSQHLLRSLATRDDDLGLHAALALDDIASRRRPPSRAKPAGGLRLAQLTMAGELDRCLSRGGRGDTGGVASLIVSLGESLAARDDVSHVLTIGRGSLTDVVADQLTADQGKRGYASLAIGDDDRPAGTSGQAWEHVPAIERGITRILRNWDPVDLLHLRMADAATLAGVSVAADHGIDVCFSLAPDPHSLIQSMQSRGELGRDSFVALASTDHLWFRARLVEQLARETPRLALFPRRQADTFFDVPSSAEGGARRAIVVPEGIDIGTIRQAEVELEQRRPEEGRLDDVLTELAARIPEGRRHLPLLLSVGRLNPVKGMDRVARAWASNPDLSESCTLVIAGGSLVDPSPTEQAVLSAIDLAVPDDHPARSGLVMLGGRPRQDIARLLASTAAGWGSAWAPGGVYANGAYKEEFGLALIEALAAGLVVVAPATGGPPTYVDDGDTGVLVGISQDLAPAVRRAFELVDRPGRAKRASKMVEDKYSIEMMANRLMDLYHPASVLQ